jgi:glucose/arabinose dehydrogenase
VRNILTLICILSVGAALAAPAAAQSGERCFGETDQCVGGRFLSYWDGNGGLPVFGLPIGDQRTELAYDGSNSTRPVTTQWFERERFEAHPENAAPYDVLLGRLGDELLRRQGRDWQSFPKGQPQDGCQFFETTAHSVCEPFLGYWRSHGLQFGGQPGVSYNESLALFGLPLSEPQMEINSSGDNVLTQWFERARFEFHPNNPDPYKVLLGRLGAEAYDPANSSGATHYRLVQAPGWPHPLEVPAGFAIDEVASGIPAPRFMAIDPADGSLVYGSSTTSQVVRLRDTDGDGRYVQTQFVGGGLAAVHSVAFVNGQLLAAAEDRLVRLSNFDASGTAQQVDQLLALPGGATDLYGHRTRTLAQAPDGKLYLSVGSSCDVCIEDTPQRAAILRLNADGSGVEIFASGLRNTVGFDWRPFSGELWGADMGRNNLGAGTVSDELNLLEQGRDYGWPYCYDDRVPNPEFNDAARCAATAPPVFKFPPHWAPLGTLFYNLTQFPASYQGDLLVAFHGTAPDQVSTLAGYNVARVRFKRGRPAAMEDLVRGWNASGDVWGRPAGLLLAPDGSLLISDDFGGRIFRLRFVGETSGA